MTSTSAIAAQCWDANEWNPVWMHSLSTMLLVGALKCRNASPEVLESYNAFAQAKHEMLAGNAFLVSAHFINRHGLSSGKIAFANYESKLANQFSGRTADPVSCARIGAYSRLAARASESDLIELASAVVPPPAEHCPAQPAIVAAPMLAAADTSDLEPPGSGYDLPPAAPDAAHAPASGEPHAVPAVAVQAAEQPADQVMAANVTTTAGPAEKSAVEPASQTSVEFAAAPAAVIPAEPAKPAPAPSAADALAEAARALAQAAVALQNSGQNTGTGGAPAASP